MGAQLSVVMLIARFYPVAAGAETQCLRLSAALQQTGHRVRVLTQSLPGTSATDTKDGVDIVRAGSDAGGWFGSLSYLFSGFSWIVRNRASISILHAHLASSPAILAVLAGVSLKIPVVVKFAGSRMTGDIATSSATVVGKIKLALIRSFADLIVCPSAEIRDELLQRGFPSARVSVIANGVTADEFAPVPDTAEAALRRQSGLPENAVVCLYTGRLHRGKGLEYLLDAWGKRADHTSVLVIAGDGELRPMVEQRRAADSTIHFMGWVDRPADLYRAADVFILPSLGEGMPNALLEAMAAGCACVSTNIGGISEVITDGTTGMLVPPADAGALTAALNALCADRSLLLNLGRAALERVRRSYAMPAISSAYESSYKTILERKLVA